MCTPGVQAGGFQLAPISKKAGANLGKRGEGMSVLGEIHNMELPYFIL